MSELLSEASLEQLFRSARTFNAWLPKEVSDEQLHQLYDLAKFGPTSANCSPMRVVFVKSKAAKAKLEPFLSDGNRAKTMEAPVTAIVATDHEFYEQLPRLFPHTDARGWFDTKPENENFGIITHGGNLFDGNTYRVRGESKPPRFVWDQDVTDWNGFRGKGLEQSGRLILSDK